MNESYAFLNEWLASALEGRSNKVRLVWLLLTLVASALGCEPAFASDFVRAPFVRCADAAVPACPAPEVGTGWVVLTAPARLRDLSPGWQLVIDRTRLTALRVEIDTPEGTREILRRVDEIDPSLGNNMRLTMPMAGRDVRALRIGFQPGSDLSLMRTIKAASPAALATYERNWVITAALVAGLMACALIYSLFLFNWLRTPFQRWYAALVSAGLVYTILWSGLIHVFVPGFPGNAIVRLDIILAGLLVGVGTIFFFSLIEERVVPPRIALAGRISAYAAIAGGVLAAVDPVLPVWIGDRLLNLAFIGCNVSILAAAIIAVQRHSRMVWFYLAGWLPILIIFNLRIARNFGLLPQSDAVDYAGFFALGFQAVMLSLAISDRVRQLVRESAAGDVEREALRSEASSDMLTGLRNRAYFQRRLDAVEEGDEPVDLVIVDIDYLKDTNDFAGHDAGDRLLAAAARRLTDAAHTSDCVARLGGDEFAVLLTGEARQSLGAVLAAVQEKIAVQMPGGNALPLSMSAGHAAWKSGDGPPARLFKEADLALYEAKAAGRSGWRTYDLTMRDADDARRRVILEARTGIARGEFFLTFQPIFDLKGGALCGHEALLRWRHPAHGVLTPAHFTAALEEPSILTELQEQVLDAALDACMGAPDPQSIAVNCVASQLQGVAAAERIFDKLAARKLSPKRLVVEVREAVLLGRTVPGSPIAECLERLRWAGVCVALDDFGTGGASLVHLQALPMDVLKIDVSLIAQLGNDDAMARIIRSIIDLAHSFGKIVVAEGVETEPQLAALKRFGCDRGQGHLLARPSEIAGEGKLSAVIG